MLRTSELRWFLPQPLTDDLLAWFGADSGDVRTDSYLLLDGCDTVGVKFREGKFEIKAQTSPPRPIRLPLAIGGKFDEWIKWTPDSEKLTMLESEFRATGKWIDVEKKRYLRQFSRANGELAEISKAEELKIGFSIEMTALTVSAPTTAWVTIGFEALGGQEILRAGAHDFLATRGKLPSGLLGGKTCMSYPAWLKNLHTEA